MDTKGKILVNPETGKWLFLGSGGGVWVVTFRTGHLADVRL